MRVAIFGAGGQLGQDLVRVVGESAHEVVPLARDAVDITHPRAVEEAVDAYRPTVMINAAAMTDVDGCERDEEAAYRINALGPRWLARQAERHGAMLVHVSTDYVFPGNKGASYHEWDRVGPVQTYGRSKLAGEMEVRAHAARHLIVRTSWLYGGPEKGFVRAILRRAKAGEALSVVTDQAGSPSYTGDVARAILELVAAGVVGTVHASGAGRASRFEFAREIVRQAGLNVAVAPTEDVPSKAIAARPVDTSLVSFVLSAAGIRMPTWQEGIQSFLEEKGA